MSKIDKLSILGVRSFDNVRSETIQFHHPLTLIVGYNGSGKTTIIECLKYVTTGEFPPNSKGGAFIHDPKLCGEKEVLAQIKVSFKSTEGTKMVCTRNLQLTVKKNTRTMKAIEGSLLMLRDGDRHVMSTRVAEMSSLMPQYLGVSKAVLDNVIFCHQDESLWPLAEPGTLKKKFDEIFEALKYTKAVDNIKILAKTQKTNLIGFKKDEESSRIDKDRGQRMMKQAEKLSGEIDALNAKRDSLGTEIKEASQHAEEAWRQSETAGLIVGELKGKRIEEKTKDESVQNLRQTLVEMTDSDDELQHMLEQYEERVKLHQADLAQQKSSYSDFVSEITRTRQAMGNKERICGSYEAQKENYDRQIKRRERLIHDAARNHHIRGYELEINDSQVTSFMVRITQMARDQNAAFEKSRRETQEELSKEQKQLNQISEKRSALNENKESSRQAIVGYDRRLTALQEQLNAIDIDEGSLAALEIASRDVDARLKEEKAKEHSASHEGQITSVEAELRHLEERKEKLDAELVEGTRQAGDSARLDYVQKELKTRQSSLETMIGAHGPRISKIVGEGWSSSTLDTIYQRILREHDTRHIDAEKQRNDVGRQLEEAQYKLKTCRENLETKKQAQIKAAQAIQDALGVEPHEYEDEVRDLNADRDTLKSDADAFKILGKYFDACIKLAREQKCCRTCTRTFGKEKEIDVLIKTLDQERRNNDVSKSIKELQETEQKLESARKVAPDHETWKRLQTDIPPLRDEEAYITASYAALSSQLNIHDTSVRECSDAKRDVESLGRTIQSIAGYHNDIQAFEGQVRELTAKQESAGLSRGMETIHDDIKQVSENIRAAKTRLTKFSAERDRVRGLITSLEFESRDVKSKISDAGFMIKEKKALEDQVSELRRLVAEQRDNMRSKDTELQALIPQLAQAQVRYDDIARRGAERDHAMQADVSKLGNTMSELKACNGEIEAYIDRGGPEELRRGRQEVEDLKAQITGLEQEQAQVVREVKELEDRLRNHEQTRRGIVDNQRFRRDQRQLQVVREEIAQLESRNAEADKTRFDQEGTRWQMIRNKKAAEQASVIGQMSSKDEALKQLMADYDTDFKDAARRHREALIKVETTKACIDDLGRYGGALDKAVMRYHSLKMEEINRIIDELWRKTYQGTDVDTILIRSENENIKSNKSYNYRVCMIKSETEMDMRGRCSAGQKVLASIIIRLALAECFGVHCGLIALDEPTTNLDRDNIRALAESLSEIIKVRRSQSNFQLIVITHDEDFLRYMNCADFADFYYRVGRNERQKSQIERQNIADVL